MKLANNPYDAYQQGRQEKKDEILAIIEDYICSFEPTIRFRDWLIKQIKEQKKQC